MKKLALALVLGAAAFYLFTPAAQSDSPETKTKLHLTAAQKDFLRLEPILVTVRSEGIDRLPPAPNGDLRFEIEPPLKPRTGGKPLPLEGVGADAQATIRDYDLTEWFQFPDKGAWTVRAVFTHNGSKASAAPIAITLHTPAKDEAEWGPMDRIHHVPWCNYDTDCFCGDTFDVVKRWPDSRFAKYCHYWNGRYSQNKKEYDKAIASYRIVIEKYPGFVLADDAEFGMVECLLAQKKMDRAREANAKLQQKLESLTRKAGGQTVVGCLARQMTERLQESARGEK